MYACCKCLTLHAVLVHELKVSISRATPGEGICWGRSCFRCFRRAEWLAIIRAWGQHENVRGGTGEPEPFDPDTISLGQTRHVRTLGRSVQRREIRTGWRCTCLPVPEPIHELHPRDRYLALVTRSCLCACAAVGHVHVLILQHVDRTTESMYA